MPPRATSELLSHDVDHGLGAAMADTLDGLSAGMFLVEGCGRILHANRAGRVVLEQGDILRSAAGRLAAREADVDQSLRNAFAAAANDGATIRFRGAAVPLRARNGTRHVVRVMPLVSGSRRRAGMAYTAAAAVFVNEAVCEGPSLPEVIAQTYKLTPSELRILLAIVKVGGVPEVAQALGIAESTVKTHLSRLFQKTGTTRQAELVRVVAGFSSPLVE